MNSMVSDLIGQKCYVYLDDVVVFGTDYHVSNLNEVLERLEKINLNVQINKCEFLKRECEFLGHIVTKDGIKPNPDKIKKILNWTLPINEKQIKQYLGLLRYYRKFIKDFARITRPMTKYLKQNVPLNTTNI